jgi:TRAP-type mannitol/chloroaromatic compound transport system substrate-binding protein
MRSPARRLSLLALASSLVLALVLPDHAAAQAAAQKNVRWKMASAFTSGLDVVGESGPIFADNLRKMSGGTLDVKFFEPGALVPAFEVFNAVAKGSIESGWTTPGFHVGQIPAAPWFTTVPFGPQAGEYLAWLRYGGGHALKDEIYARHGVKGISCVVITPEASGWFRKEIKSVEDLKGLKMRFFGLGARVMQKLGVQTQLIPPGEIYPALERGIIDATELAFPSLDIKQGFHQVAKHYYFPGWHQQASVTEFLVNLKRWNELSEAHRRMIEVACDANITWSYVTSEARQFGAMKDLVEKHGVKIHYWSDAILARMRSAWEEVLAEESAKDPDFKRAHESYAAFRKQYAIWKEHGYLK